MKYAATRELGDARETFTVPFLSVSATALVSTVMLSLLSAPVAGIINLPVEHAVVVQYSAWILCLDAVALIPFASLRMERKAKRFAAIKLSGIAVNVACNVVVLVKFHMGVEGIFLSGVISSAFTVALLLPSILRSLSPHWIGELYRALLRFGLPTVPAGIAAMMIQVINRPILEALTDKATVGVFQANYRLGIFMMLVVSMFDFAWRPFFFSQAQEKGAKELFARILTYFLLLMTSVFLLLSFFLDDLVKPPFFWGHSILPAAYWSGLAIVPVVMLAYVCLGVYNNLVAGIYIEKKTQYLPIATFVGALVNVAANYLLIPPMGMMGAAVATLLSYALMALLIYVMARRVYPVTYEGGRILRIVGAATAVYALHMFVHPDGFTILWKLFLLIVFLLLIYGMRFFEPAELRLLSGLWKRVSKTFRQDDIPPDNVPS